MSKPDIGFCGLGAMGFGMATHLVKSGYSVHGFDVYGPTLEKFEKAGGKPAKTLRESAAEKTFYIIMVATAQQAEAALFGENDSVVGSLPKGATLLLCSTVPASYAQDVGRKLKEKGREDILFIDAPVSGGAIRAADGTLSIMAGASDAAIDRGKWLLKELSAPKKLFIVDGGIGAGSNMKMVHQVLAAIQILAVSEAFGFAARIGLDGKSVREEVVKSEGWSWMFENRSVRTLAEDYFPGASALAIIAKDTGIITSQARLLSFPALLCTTAEQVYFVGLDRGWTSHDDASLVRLWSSEPVSSIHESLHDEPAKAAKLKLVVSLLSAIHLVAATESIAFAKHVGLPLPQLYELAVDAAGGSTMFKSYGEKIIQILSGAQQGEDLNVQRHADELRDVLDEAQKFKIPLYLGSAAFNLLLMSQKDGKADLATLVKAYQQRVVAGSGAPTVHTIGGA